MALSHPQCSEEDNSWHQLLFRNAHCAPFASELIQYVNMDAHREPKHLFHKCWLKQAFPLSWWVSSPPSSRGWRASGQLVVAGLKRCFVFTQQITVIGFLLHVYIAGRDWCTKWKMLKRISLLLCSHAKLPEKCLLQNPQITSLQHGMYQNIRCGYLGGNIG